MPTLHEDRWLIVSPAARQAALNAYWAAQIDTDGGGEFTFTVSLNATGLISDPATHYVSCTSLTRAQAGAFVRRLCILAGIAQPSGWEDWTKAERLQWLTAQRPAIVAATGIRFWRSDNDGEWDDFRTRLEAAGLKPQQAPLDLL